MTTLKLTPVVRLMMTMDNEIALDKNGVFNDQVWKQYLATTEIAEKQRDSMTKSLLTIDALLAILLSGKNLKLPVIDTSLVDLPACREVLTILSSILLMFTVVYFINAQCYSLLADQFAKRRAATDAIDPDFVSAADKYFHFALKIFRPKLNIWGPDFYSPRRSFTVFSTAINFFIAAVFILFPTAHFCLVGYSFYQTISTYDLNFFIATYCVICSVINFLSIAIWIGSSTSFEFDVLQPINPIDSSR